MTIKNAYTERVGWVDSAKAIAMFFIVFAHQLADGALYMYLYSFHVVMFFFLSGYTFSSEKSTGNFIKGKLRTVMVPYYIFSAVSIILFRVFGIMAAELAGRTMTLLSVKECIIGMLYGNRATGLMRWNTPLWFLPCLFVLVTVMYFADKYIIKRCQKKAYTAAIALMLGIVLLNMYIVHIPPLPFGTETALNMSPFFLAGKAVKEFQLDKKFTEKVNIPLRLLIAAAGAGAGFVISKLNRTEDMVLDIASGRIGEPYLFILGAAAGVATWCIVAGFAENRVFLYAGQNTLPVLLMHKFPVMLFEILLSAVKLSGNMPLSFLLSVINMAMCLAAGWIVEKLIPFAIGKRKNI